MPPKPKEVPKKALPPIVRPSISESSLYFTPDDVIEGFQERLETGIDWTRIALAIRYHKAKCHEKEIPTLAFSQALSNKLKKSVLNGFLEEKSALTLDEQWEVILPMTLWDVDKFSNEEGKVCFHSVNCISNDLEGLIKRCVKCRSRGSFKTELKAVSVLRVNDSEMTELDNGVSEFSKLVTLNLCGNLIKELDASLLPPGLRMLELQANGISETSTFAEHLPSDLLHLGLAKNLLTNESVEGLHRLPRELTVLDLSDNDIYDLCMVLEAVGTLPHLKALSLAGNPCSVCMGYAPMTLSRLPRLRWLDAREVLSTDRPADPFQPHPDDTRSAYFYFTVFRVMSALQPPKPDKGAVTTFHVELELPLLDSARRKFLMFRRYESLTEMLPIPEDDELLPKSSSIKCAMGTMVRTTNQSQRFPESEESSHESDIYKRLTAKDSREICHFTTFESNRVQWNKMMTFQEPVTKIFCPDLTALRDTFRTVVTVRLVYSVSTSAKPPKDKKSASSLKAPGEQRVVLAAIKCALQNPDWSHPAQHFHWDDSLGTDEAIHWGDGDLSVLSYTLTAPKVNKGKPEADPATSTKQAIPDNLTCHFGFGIETIRI